MRNILGRFYGWIPRIGERGSWVALGVLGISALVLIVEAVNHPHTAFSQAPWWFFFFLGVFVVSSSLFFLGAVKDVLTRRVRR